MSKVHMTLKGEWVLCHARTRECPREYHLPNTDVEEAKKLPMPFLEQLFGPLGGKPSVTGLDGTQYWEKPRTEDMDAGPLVAPIGPVMTQGGGLTYLSPHRDYDLPAVVGPDGHREWWQLGQLHREGDKPAVIKANGTVEWHWRGSLHRAKAPAVITSEGDEIWFIQGHLIDPKTGEPHDPLR